MSPVAPDSTHSGGSPGEELELGGRIEKLGLDLRIDVGRQGLDLGLNLRGAIVDRLAVAAIDVALQRIEQGEQLVAILLGDRAVVARAAAGERERDKRREQGNLQPSSHRGESSKCLSAPLARSLPHVQAAGEMLRQVGGDDRVGGAVDLVLDPVEGRAPGLGVELEPGCARIAVARLADAARD